MHDIAIGADILAGNNEVATENRGLFHDHGVYVFNLMSSPGAGKTSLLEQTLKRLKDRYRFAVIEGDIQSDDDLQRVLKVGVPGIQINTHGACHLNSVLVHNVLGKLDLDHLDCLVIENVGNLVCPAEFDLGEDDKVAVLSVTEGADKPRKYPVMFHNARALVVNKIDLMPHTDFDLDRAVRDAQRLNLDLPVFPLSCRSGEGLDAWLAWLEARIQRTKRLANH
jgi:hydrogenase nickel incorporation protein HypB